MTQLLAGTHGSLRAADSARGRRGSRLRARLGGLLLAVLVGDAGHAVPGEVCHLQGQGDWGPIDAYTGSVSGCVDLGPDDHVVIDAGAEVRTVDDLRMDGVTPGLTLQVHGAWIVDSADRRGGAGPLRVAVNGNAFVGVSSSVGARVEALGRVLAWGIDHTAVPVYVESPATSPGSYASVGAVVPCPDLAGQEDCAGSGSGRPERLRITRPAEPLWTSYLARVTTGHRLCFFTPDDRRFTPPSQAGFCFEIVEVGATHLDIDVRRSAGVDESSYPDALRQHALTQLAATLATGERCFTTADVIAADGERVGQWVQLESAGGPGPPQLVSVAEDEVAPGVDRFCAADALGVASAHGAGERVWFGWGVESGDPFWIDAPIVFESATGGDCDATVRFLGDVSLRGVSFRRHGGVSVIGPGTTLSGCERLWVYAKRSPRGAQFLWQDLDTVSCRWMAASTAGDRMPECAVGGTPVDPDVHGLECRNCRSFGVEDLGSAFGVDDLVYASTSGAAPGPAFVAGERWNLSPMGSPAFSGQLLDARQGGGARNVAVADVACARCSSCDGSGVLFLGSTHPGAIAWQVDRIAAIGTCGGFESTSGASKLEVRDATVVDARPGVGALLPDRVIGGVVRGTRSSQANSWLSIGGVERSDLLVVDHDLATPALWSLAPAEELENVLVADLRCSSRSGAGGCAVLGDAGIPAHGAALRRVSLVQTPGLPSAGATHQLLLAALPLGAQIGGLLFYGFGGPDVVAASDFGNAAAMADPARFTWQEPLCHWANLPVGPAADNLAAYQSGAVPGVFADPELADPGSGDFEPVAGGVADAAPCGIAGGVSGPGVRGRSWALGLAGLKPEFVGGSLTECGNGLDDDGDERIDHEDPGCSDVRDASERPRRRCGLGFEAALVLAAGWRRRPRA